MFRAWFDLFPPDIEVLGYLPLEGDRIRDAKGKLVRLDTEGKSLRLILSSNHPERIGYSLYTDCWEKTPLLRAVARRPLSTYDFQTFNAVEVDTRPEKDLRVLDLGSLKKLLLEPVGGFPFLGWIRGDKKNLSLENIYSVKFSCQIDLEITPRTLTITRITLPAERDPDGGLSSLRWMIYKPVLNGELGELLYSSVYHSWRDDPVIPAGAREEIAQRLEATIKWLIKKKGGREK